MHLPARRAIRRTAVSVACACVLLAAATGAGAQQPATAAEQSGFERHTTHDEMMDYLVAVRATSTDMRLASYGESREGRTLPYAIFSRPLVSQPWEAALLGKPIVLIVVDGSVVPQEIEASAFRVIRCPQGAPVEAIKPELTEALKDLAARLTVKP